MSLDNVRGHRRSAGFPRASIDLMERERPPLPSFDDAQPQAAQHAAADTELAEFVAFFTGEQQTVTAAPVADMQPRASQGQPGRVRRATQRVVDLAAHRPVVHVPTRAQRVRADHDEEPRRAIKLPPVWALANLAIVAMLLFAFAPQISTAGAAAGCQWYTVRSGDTLSRIGQRYNVSVSSLARANDIANVNRIFIAQHLCIPMMPMAHTNQPAPTGSHPPVYSAPSNVRAFINYALPYARSASARTGWPVSVILAQWGLETGWRTRTYTGFNWGNCGAMPGQPVVGGISKPGSPAAFAYAYSPQQGVDEFVHVAHLGYYSNVSAASRFGANAAARALGRSPWDWGHYTNRGDPGSSLISIMNVYNLYWYDTH